jgi:hypothetical protein
MRFIPSSALIIVLAVVPASAAQAPGPQASLGDIERLQDDLENLDALLETLEPNDAQADAFRVRAQSLQEDVVYLKVKGRRHRESGGLGTGLTMEEVERVRRGAAGLREDIERAFGGGGRGAYSLPAGLEFTVRLGRSLSSKTARMEDRFDATVDVPVRTDQGAVLPAGTMLQGIVRNADPAERPSKSGRLDLDFYALHVGTTRLDVRARVVQIGPRPQKGGASAGKKAGIGGLLGGVLGVALGGGAGAVIGIVTGGAGAVLDTKGQEVELPEGTRLTVRLDQPLEVPAGAP